MAALAQSHHPPDAQGDHSLRFRNVYNGGSMFGLLWSKLRARRGWCAECDRPILGKRHSYRTCSSECEDAVRDALAQI